MDRIVPPPARPRPRRPNEVRQAVRVTRVEIPRAAEACACTGSSRTDSTGLLGVSKRTVFALVTL